MLAWHNLLEQVLTSTKVSYLADDDLEIETRWKLNLRTFFFISFFIFHFNYFMQILNSFFLDIRIANVLFFS